MPIFVTKSVAESIAQVFRSSGKIASLQPAVCRSRVVHSSRRARAPEKAKALSIMLAVITASPDFTVFSPFGRHPLPYTTSGFRSVTRFHHSCDDGVVLSRRTSSCNPLALTHSSALQSGSTAPATVANPSIAVILPPSPRSRARPSSVAKARPFPVRR